MALQLKIERVTGKLKEGTNLLKVSFRDYTEEQEFRCDAKDHQVFLIDKHCEWPLVSALAGRDYINFTLFHKMLGTVRSYGICQVYLHKVIETRLVQITDDFCDCNNTPLPLRITFSVHYTSTGISEITEPALSETAVFLSNARSCLNSLEGNVSRQTSSASLSREKPIYFKRVRYEAKQRSSKLLSMIRPRLRRQSDTESGHSVDSDASAPQNAGSDSTETLAEDDVSENDLVGIKIDDDVMGNGRTINQRATRSAFHSEAYSRGLKARDFQVCITVIEARLSGPNIDPVVCVQVGNHKKYTTEKLATHRPYYNEYFVFDFHEATASFMDKLITLTVVCNSRRLLRRSMLLGNFKLDIGTVYEQPDHQFFHKWAVLMDPEDVLSGAKGYLKCNIAVCGKGESIKVVPRKEKEDDENNIEGNLLLPAGVNSGPLRQQAHYILRVHSAEALSPLSTGVVANVRKALTGDAGLESMQTFIQVSFAGHVGATSPRSGSRPVWWEQIVFREMFPPLVRRMRIQLVSNDKFGTSVIATHFLDLSSVSDEGRNGFLPTYGPTFIDLYGSATENVLLDRSATLNEGMGEGVVYRGRLLLSLAVHVFDQTAAFSTPGVDVEQFMQSHVNLGVKDEFLFFGCITDVSILNKRLVDKSIHLEVTSGGGPLTTDGGYLNKAASFSEDALTSEMFGRLCVTPDLKPVMNQSSHAHIPFGDRKPCVFALNQWYDMRWRLYHANYLSKICNRLEIGLSDAEFLLHVNKPSAEQKFQLVLDNFAADSGQYLMYLKARPTVRGMNKLDKERLRMCQREMDRLGVTARSLKLRAGLLEYKLKVATDLTTRLKRLVDEPQGGLPDVIVWLIQGSKRIAYHRIAAKDIIHSSTVEERGIYCSKMHNFYLKLPGRKLDGSGEMWRIQGQVTACFWLGVNNKREGLLNGLPGGFVINEHIENIDKEDIVPPSLIEFVEKNDFEIRCHLYQARSLLASDETGLSDPFARVIFQGCSASTQIIEETLNPSWDETLVLRPVTLYGKAENVARNPPTLVIEIFDHDQMGKNDFMGQVLAVPTVRLMRPQYSSSRATTLLEWFPVYRGIDRGGELLAAFELIQLDQLGELPEDVPRLPPAVQKEDNDTTCSIVPVPESIRPTLAKFRMEVIFWGIRDLKRINLLSVDKPRIDIECSGHVLSSSVINNYNRNPNFMLMTKTLDLELPENHLYWPAITIRCVACRSFGRDTLVGTQTIQQPNEVICRCEKNAKPELYDDESESMFEDCGAMAKETSSLSDKERKKSKSKYDETALVKLDWWTKYYASVDVIHEEERITRLSLMKDGGILEGGITGTMRLLSMPNTNNSSYQAAFRKKLRNDPIAKLEIYTCELERLPQFEGFRDWINTYDLQRGVDKGDGDDCRRVGRFKGSIRICKYPLSMACQKMKGTIHSNETTNVLVRIYVVKANDLHPMDLNGKADPYLYLKLGRTIISDKENYISKQLNPVFGKCFEFEALFPQESQLCLQVYDWDLVGRDDLIGQTCLDLEDRFYSRHRGNCGLAQTYDTEGYNSWRDPMKPSQILSRLCKEHELEGPFYMPGQVRIGRKTFTLPSAKKSSSKMSHMNGWAGSSTKLVDSEVIALFALRNWHQVAGYAGCHLVPEHVETRCLYHPDRPGIIQGKVEMWVDMFPMDTRPHCPVDISPRKPKAYELRVIIWNTDDVVLEDDAFFTGEKMSDIYVKGWIKGPEDTQCTDIHYRSLTGEGNFNWRFIFPFDYLEAEEKVVLTRKENIFSWDETELKIPPRLELQVWDADNFSADDFLGSLSLYLTQIPRGAKTSRQCSLEMIAEDSEVPIINLFKQRRIKGWWPFIAKTDTGEHELTGKVEAEFHLLTAEEAEQNPAGYGRNDPNGLDKPNRPDSSFIWFLNPLKSMRYIIWHNYKWVIVKVVILILIVFLFVLFIYSFPGYMAKRILGA